MNTFMDAKTLRDFINNEDLLFVLSKKEAEVILEYLKSNKSSLFPVYDVNGIGTLMMSVKDYPYEVKVTIDDVIDLALDIHYEKSHRLDVRMKKATGCHYKSLKSLKKALKKDKIILDALFARTVYGKGEKKGACFV